MKIYFAGDGIFSYGKDQIRHIIKKGAKRRLIPYSPNLHTKHFYFIEIVKEYQK